MLAHEDIATDGKRFLQLIAPYRAGIVALSLALSPNMKDKGRYTEIPGADYPSIQQACVILKSSQQKDTAKAFLSFIKTPAVAGLFRAYGFAVPRDSTAQ